MAVTEGMQLPGKIYRLMKSTDRLANKVTDVTTDNRIRKHTTIR